MYDAATLALYIQIKMCYNLVTMFPMHTYSYNYVHFYCRIHGLLPSLVKFMEGRFHGLAS